MRPRLDPAATRVTATYSLSPAARDWVRAEAKRRGCSQSQVVNDIILGVAKA